MNFVTIYYTRFYWDVNIRKILVTVSSGRLKKSRYWPRTIFNLWTYGNLWKILSPLKFHDASFERIKFCWTKILIGCFQLLRENVGFFGFDLHFQVQIPFLSAWLNFSTSGSRKKKPHEHFSCWKLEQSRVWSTTWCVVQHSATMHFWSLSSQLIEHSFCHIKF